MTTEYFSAVFNTGSFLTRYSSLFINNGQYDTRVHVYCERVCKAVLEQFQILQCRGVARIFQGGGGGGGGHTVSHPGYLRSVLQMEYVFAT